MLANVSLRHKLLGALLAVGLLGVFVTGWQAYRRAERALQQISINQLTSVLEERRRAIEGYFADVQREALRLAESSVVTGAIAEFSAACRALERQVERMPTATREGYRAAVDAHYRDSFLPRLGGLTSTPGVTPVWQYLPADPTTVVLQAVYIADNPHSEGARDGLDRGAGGGPYTAVHGRFHPFIRSAIRQLGYYDLFLIDHETGRIVYTVGKQVDFGTSLLSGQYSDTHLAAAFRAARDAIDADFVRLTDFDSYAPSFGAPSAFVAAPIFKGGRRLGVLALQLPVSRIDAVMTGSRRWKEQGLGESGETYLVGADSRMRSNSRFFVEDPEQYLAMASQSGVSELRRRLMKTHQSTILFQEISTPAAKAAGRGQTGTLTQSDYRGVAVLAAHAPVAIPGLHWGIVAKIDTAEAFAPIRELRRAVLWTAAGMAAVVVVLALVLARSLTAPIHRLIAGMQTLGHGDLSYRISEARRDEIGRIASAFNRMAAELETTTVSRDHLTSILDSMSDAVVVVRPPAEGADWREAAVVTVNPAACALLGRPPADILGRSVGSVMQTMTAQGAAGLWLEEVLRLGRIGGREGIYKIHDGREIPLLFSSAVMRQGAGAVQGVVWAAHDLTELKALEARSAFIRETFGRYVSEEVVASLLSSPEALALGGELRKVTVMMTDLRGFTALAERLTPEEVIGFLNHYLQTMVDLIMHYHGTINEIMGDGILVIFGAPTTAADDADRAVACAVAMQLAMHEVNERSRTHGHPAVEMGIGIHTGRVIVGNIGSARRMKYAAVGTHVNLTGRIESYTTGGQILISEDTLRDVASVVQVGRPMRLEPKGAKGELTVWEVKGIAGSHGLLVPSTEEPLILLTSPIPIRYAVLEGKHVGAAAGLGAFVRVSTTGAEVRSPTPMPPLSNVKIWVDDPGAATHELYAKVVAEAPGTEGSFAVRFTALAPEAAAYFGRRLAEPRSA